MVNIPLFAGFHTCQVVQNFFHQQYHEQGNYQEQIQFPCFPTQSVTRRSVMNVLHSLLTKPCNLKSNLRCKSQKQKQKRENVDTNINFRPTAAVFSSPFNQSSNISTIQRTPLQSLEMSNPCLSRKRPLETSPPRRFNLLPPRKPPDIPRTYTRKPNGLLLFFFGGKSRIMDCFIFRRRWISPESQRWQCLQSAPWFKKSGVSMDSLKM